MEQETNRSLPQSDASPFSDVLSNILSNPEMMEKIRSIAEQLPAGASSDLKKEAAPAVEPIAPQADGLAALLSNPQMLEKLPQMMSVIGPLMGGVGEPMGPHSQEKNSETCRNDLLVALKPFLSPERCRAIDLMLRISKLGNVLKQIK